MKKANAQDWNFSGILCLVCLLIAIIFELALDSYK